MRIRQIMNCLFTTCSPKDSVYKAVQIMTKYNVSYLVVVDDNNHYKGVINASSLLEYQDDYHKSLTSIIQKVAPVSENEEITTLKNIDSEIIPVINSEHNVIGIINLNSFLEYLPEVLASFKEQRVPGRKDPRRSSKYTIDDIVGQSKSILLLKERIIAAAKSKSTVLILGETGTGKELVAHAIHKLSDRRHQPFVRINCAAIPENLLESELFGYEQGAFTGAVKGGHPGKFQLADGGTIFLDEIGDMSLFLQSKILRVLQEREIEKIGGHFPIPVDVRVIAATHCNLLDMVKQNKFRQDLYYRLHVFPIQTPPLRFFVEDIPLLVDLFITKMAENMGITKPRVDQGFLTDLMKYHWPGNIRELMNITELAVSLSNGVITKEHLHGEIQFVKDLESVEEDRSALRTQTDEAEREAILKTIKMYRGNKIKASEALGISRSSLYNKMKKYNIDLE